MPKPACDSALSDLILEATRQAMPGDWRPFFADRGAWLNRASDKQKPLLVLLIALIEASASVAAAIDDNAWDDAQPLPGHLATGLARDADAIGKHLLNSAAVRANGHDLPSFSDAAALQLV